LSLGDDATNSDATDAMEDIMTGNSNKARMDLPVKNMLVVADANLVEASVRERPLLIEPQSVQSE
jgi:hypothetical protein